MSKFQVFENYEKVLENFKFAKLWPRFRKFQVCEKIVQYFSRQNQVCEKKLSNIFENVKIPNNDNVFSKIIFSRKFMTMFSKIMTMFSKIIFSRKYMTMFSKMLVLRNLPRFLIWWQLNNRTEPRLMAIRYSNFANRILEIVMQYFSIVLCNVSRYCILIENMQTFSKLYNLES